MPNTLGQEAIREFRMDVCRVAARRFAELGYAGVTLRALADELGCSRMTPYRYFKDKADILAAVRADGFRRLADLGETTARAESDPMRRVEALSRAYLRFAAEEPDSYRLMFEFPEKLGARPTAELHRQAVRSQLPLFEAVREARRAGVIDGNPMTVTHLLWAALHGLASLHLSDKLQMGRSFEELSDELVTLLSRLARRGPTDNRAME